MQAFKVQCMQGLGGNQKALKLFKNYNVIFVKCNYKAAGEKLFNRKENYEAFSVAFAREVKHYFGKCSFLCTGIITSLV